MEKKIDRRESFRMPFNAEVICHVNKKYFLGTVRDLSITGLFMKTTDCPPTASKCDIEIVLRGDHSRLRIDKLKGIVIRCEEGGVGIQFDDRLEWVALVPIYFHKMQEEETT